MAHPLPVVRLFTRIGCSLCEPVKFILHKTQQKYPFRYVEIDIGQPEHHIWNERYTNDIPVVDINGVECARHRLNESEFIQKLKATTATNSTS